MAGRRVLEAFGPLDGGVPEHVLRLSEGLLARGWEVEVAAPPEAAAAVLLRERGVPVHPFSFGRAPGPRDVAATRRLRALDRERGYDVVHGHSSKAGALVRALPRPERIVYTPHCFAFAASFGTLPGVQRALYRVAEQALLRRAGTVIAVSEWERQEGERRLRGAADRLEVVHNGVAAPGDPAPHPALAAFKGDRPLAGTVAVLRPQKDPLALVRAAELLRRRGALGFRIAIVGNGMLRDDVVAAIERAGLGDDVRWFPYEADSASYLAALDAFVLPSLWESFPLAVLEAMAVGVPVIATRAGGTPEAVEDGVTGRLIPATDDEALAGAMAALLADAPARAALGDRGRRAFAERFTLDRMVDGIAALYERALLQRIA